MEKFTKNKGIVIPNMSMKVFVLLITFFTITNVVTAQTKGLIYKQAAGAGQAVLDPNTDGYSSASTLGFVTDDEAESEIPYTPLPSVGAAEPDSDLGPGPSCGFTDLVKSADNNTIYTYLDASDNLMFRFRLGGTANNSKGYSILIDTDQKFGATGSNADPNYVPGNPGFEIEVVLRTNFGVGLYNVDGTVSPVAMDDETVTRPYDNFAQKSIALSEICGDDDYFYDFYIPFSDITLYFPSVTTSTPLRMVGNTVINPKAALGNNGISDLGGIDDTTGITDGLWEDLIDVFPPTSSDDIASGATLAPRAACPGISAPISVGATSVSGTSVEVDGTIIEVFKDGVSIGTTTVASSSWTLSGISPALAINQVITATAKVPAVPGPEKSASYDNCNPVSVGGSCSATPSASSLFCSSDRRIVLHGLPSGATIKFYKVGTGFVANAVENGTLGDYAYSCNGNLNTGNCSQGGNCGTPLSGTYYYTVTETGSCESKPSPFICVSGTPSEAPTITTAQAIETTNTISGTLANTPTGTATITLYVNDVATTSTTTTTNTSWTISGITGLTVGDVLSVYNQETSECTSVQSNTLTVVAKSATPVISGDYCINVTDTITFVNGISSEDPGSVITIYTGGTGSETSTTLTGLVQANGSWSVDVSSANIGVTTQISATAKTGTELESNFSTKVTVKTKTPDPSNQLTLDGPITEGDASISGTTLVSATDAFVIQLYIDGTAIEGATYNVGVGATTTTWVINGLDTPFDKLFAEGVAYVTITNQTSGFCESDPSNSVTIDCIDPINQTFSATSATSVCEGESIAFLIDSTENNIVYQLIDQLGFGLGSAALGNGSSLALTATNLNALVDTISVKAQKIGITCETTFTPVIDVTVTATPVVSLDNDALQVCRGETSTNLPYTIDANGPATHFSIDFDAAAEAAGLVDVLNETTVTNPVVISVPGTIAVGVYNGAFTIRNSISTDCTSNSVPFTITVIEVLIGSASSTNPDTCSSADGTITLEGLEISTSYSALDYNVDGVTINHGAFISDSSGDYTINALNIGSYTDFVVTLNGCDSNILSGPISLIETNKPTITLGTSPTVSSGATTADLPYTAVTNGANQYVIDFDAQAETAGFADITTAVALPASPISLVVPGSAPVDTYNGTVSVINSATGCISITYAFTVTIETGTDTDGDGIPDNTDTDDDNDGNPDSTDPNPLDVITADDALSMIQGTSNTVNVLTNDDFLPGANTSIVDAGTGSAAGTVSFDALTGVMTYTPTAGEKGTTVTIDYTVCNTSVTPQICGTRTVSVSVVLIDDRTCNEATLEPFLGFQNPTGENGADPNNPQYDDVFRFTDVVTGIDGLIKMVNNGSGAVGVVQLDQSGVGIPAAFQPQIDAGGAGDRSVDFEITFVIGGTTTPINLSFFATGLDIDGFGAGNYEYIEVSGPDSFNINNPTVLDINNPTPGLANGIRFQNNDGGGIPDIGTDPEAAFTAYFENRSTLIYRAGKVGADGDRFASLYFSDITYDSKVFTFITDPIICGTVEDEFGDPLANVTISLSNGDSTVTDSNGDYSFIVPGNSGALTITESDLVNYTSVSDTDGANDNQIVVTIASASSLNNNFVDTNDTDGDGNPNQTDPNPTVPTTAPDTLTVTEGTSNTVNVLTNDDFLPGANTSLVDAGTGSATGTVSFNASTGVMTYTPAAGEEGTTVTVDYTVCNTAVTPQVCETNTVTITVQVDTDGDGDPDVTDPDDDNDGNPDTTDPNPLVPTSAPDTLTVVEGTSNTVNVLTNDDFLPGANTSLVDAGTGSATGTVSFDASTGVMTYTPAAGEEGTTVTVDYTVCNTAVTPQVCETNTVTITVQVDTDGDGDPDVTDPDDDNDGNPDTTDPNPLVPTSAPDTLIVTEGTSNTVNVLTNDDFLPGANTSLVDAGTGSATGTVSFNASTGVMTYTPAAGEEGTTVTVDYTVCNTAVTPQVCETNTVTITVQVDTDGDGDPDVTDPDDDNDGNPDTTDPNPLVPTTAPDTLTVVEGTSNTVNVLTNDDFLPGANTSLVDAGTGSATGTVSFDASTGVMTYTPAAGEEGTTVTVDYTVCNTAVTPQVCETNTVTITVQVDTDGDGDPDVTDPDDDNDGNPDTTDPNPLVPTTAPDTLTVVEGTSNTVKILTNDDFVPGANTSLVDAGTGSATGTVSFNASTGVITYTPAAGEEGTIVTVDYTVCNTAVTPQVCGTNTVTIRVQVDTDGDGIPDSTDPDDDNDGNPDTTDPNPLVPTSAPDTLTIVEGTSNTVNVLTNDDFLPGANTSLVDAGTGSATGTVSFDASTGVMTYTPAAGEEGTTVTIDYTVCNTAVTPQVCETNTVTITVQVDTDGDGDPDVTDPDDDNDGNPDTTDPNPLVPTSAPDTLTVVEGTSNTVNVLTNDDFLPGANTSLVDAGTGSATGTVSFDASTGVMTYTPAAGEEGTTVTVDYTVCNTAVTPQVCETNTVTITVQVDTDGDGDPDVTDPDDDNDGNPDTTDPNPLVPTSAPDTLIVTEGTSNTVNVLTNDDFVPGANTSLVDAGTGSATGTVSFDASTGVMTYTPAAGEEGTTVTVDYTVCNTAVTPQVCETNTVTITVQVDTDGDGDPDVTDPDDDNDGNPDTTDPNPLVPTSAPDTLTVIEGTSNTVNVLTNDDFLPGANTSLVDAGTGSATGTVSYDASTGVMTYTPAAGEEGTTVTVDYTVCNTAVTPQVCETNTVTITVQVDTDGDGDPDVTDPDDDNDGNPDTTDPNPLVPTTAPDTLTVTEGTSNTVNVLTNDDFLPGANTSLVDAGTGSATGTVSFDASTGVMTYTPAAGEEGTTVTVDYTVCNTAVTPQVCETNTVTITVQVDTDGDGDPDVTDPDDDNDGNPDTTDPNPLVPTTAPDTLTVVEGTSNTVNVLTNDDFLPGANTSLVDAGTGSATGTVSFDASTGVMTYTPAAGEEGTTVTVDYTVCNTAVTPQVCETNTVTITVQVDTDGDGDPDVTDPDDDNDGNPDTTDPNPLVPTSAPDTLTVTEGTSNTVNVLTNDDFVPGANTSLVDAGTGSATGTVSFDASTGVMTYTPAAGEEGTTVTVDYTVCNTAVTPQVCETNTVTITVQVDTDGDGDPDVTDPDDDNDGNPDTTDPNPLVPTSAPDTLTVIEGTSNTVNVLTNDDFLPGANTSLVDAGTGSATGTVSFDASTGVMTYTPAAGEEGTTVTVDYTVCNTAVTPQVCETNTVTITVQVDTDGDGDPDVTDPDDDNDGNPDTTDPNPLVPTSAPDTLTVTEGTSNTVNVLTNDDFLPGANTSLVDAGTGSATGTVSFNASTGVMTYTPAAGEEGTTVTVDYTVCNTAVTPQVCETNTVTITVQVDTDGDGDPDVTDPDDDNDGNPDTTDPNPLVPTTAPDTLTVVEGTSNTVNVLTNDDFLPGANTSLVDAGTGSATGTVSFDASTGVMTYTPAAGEEGTTVTVDYTVCNTAVTPQVCETNTVTITVQVDTDGDSDPDVTDPDDDNDGNPDTTDPNPLVPTSAPDTLTVTEGTSNTVNVLANDDFLPGANTSLVDAGTGSATGTVSFDASTGVMTYTPAAGEEGTTVTVDYTVCNTAVTPQVCETNTVTITVLIDTDGDGDPDILDPDDDNDGNPDTTDPNPLVPTTAPDTLTVVEGTSNTVNVLTNDDFLPGANTSLVDAGTGSATGTVSFNASTGVMTYTPAAGEEGTTVTLDYTVCNTAVTPQVCETNTVTITVQVDTDGDGDPDVTDPDDDNDGNPDTTDPNPLVPTTAPDTLTVVEGTSNTVNVLTNDDFVPGANTSIVDAGTGSATGTVSFDASTGVMTYTPAAGEEGATVTVDYMVCNTAVTPQVCETNTVTITVQVDTDNDTTPDILDLDDDNDGIPDTLEAGGNNPDADADNDGVPAYLDEDDSNNLVGDDTPGIEQLYDFDGDGIANHMDLDSDNDAIPDVIEAGYTDANNDGLVDSASFGANGLADELETTPESGVLVASPINTDATSDASPGYTLYNFLDVDSDNDAISDTTEAFSNNAAYNDVDNDGQVDGFIDADNNGWHDPIDAEVTFPTVLNSDADSLPNYLDLDSDGDGLPDTFEGNFQVSDRDNNGIVGTGIPADSDGDGLADTNDPDAPGNVLGGFGFNKDRDDDGVNNYMDIDIDNDGIIDNIEGQSTFAYRAPTGLDTDGDGIDNAYDVNNGGVGIGYTNTDGGSAPDYADTNSDVINGIGGDDFDIAENATDNSIDGPLDLVDNGDGTAVPDGMVDPALFVDVDGDGLHDEFEYSDPAVDSSNNTSNTLNATNNNQLPTDHPDVDEIGGDRDWREAFSQDRDQDGVVDTVDLDSDNDGILDIYEDNNTDGDNNPRTNPTDSDGDGEPDYFDLDSDNDGILDFTEAGGVGDLDNSGMPGTGVLDRTEVDANGIPFAVSPTGLIPYDTDGDGQHDFHDIDSDNDGIADVIEAGGIDTNGDGQYGSGNTNDVDADGIIDAVDVYDNRDGNLDEPLGGTPLMVVDTDGDGQLDQLDLDSDNDTIPDNVEGQSTVNYIAPSGLDTDNDGLDDSYDVNNLGLPIIVVNTDGTDAPDYLDLDSDNDGLFDILESGNGVADTNADGETDGVTGANGLDDNYDDGTAGDTFLDANGALDNTQTDNFPDADGDVLFGGDVDYRDATFNDFDGDGVADNSDLDNDNDGITDIEESNGINPMADDDGDTIVNYLDADFCTLNTFGVCANLDLDNDGIPNHLDSDSDGDGCNDANEAYADPNADGGDNDYYGTGNPPATNPDGTVIAASYATPQDTDANTVADYLEVGPDADGDLISDACDLDDDNDGVLDTTEIANGTDPNDACDYNVADVTEPITSGNDCDGDGVIDADEITNGSDPKDPCDPVQTAGYTGYDATNPIWQAADCDGDGVTNGDEVTNGTDPYSNIDTDGDGINDDLEINNGTDETNPCDPVQSAGYTGYDATNAIWQAADCDGDGVTNGDEVTNGTDPYSNIDTDGDGINDDLEINNGTDETNPCDPAQAAGYTGYDATNAIWQAADCDGDGVTNGDEVTNGTDPYSNVDTDGDGINDDLEINNGTDETNPCDPAQSAGYTGYDATNAIWQAADCDGDGVTNGDEVTNGTDPYSNVDTDGDGINDDLEINNGTDETNPCDPAQAAGYTGYDATNAIWQAADCDGDGVTNGDEVTNGTDPYSNVDTDGDGINDDLEINNGTDETNPCDPAQAAGYTGYDATNAIWQAADCDGDGVTNGDEVTNGTDPYSNVDTDGDGINDDLEINNGTDETNPCDPAQSAGYTGYDATNAIWQAADCDGDGVTNGDEVTNGTDPYAASGDTDGDGIDDDNEINNGTDETNPCDPAQSAGYTGYDATNAIWQAADCDGDGVTNGDEATNGTDPYAASGDTDGDGIDDDNEINNGTDETNPCDPAQSAGYTGYDATNAIWQAADCDGDGVTNGDEVTNGTDPYSNVDTDGDGINDDLEINNGTDETNPCDPAQSAGYTGYDATNAIWQAADCDGDGVTNGDEVTNGTDPYSNVDTDGDGINDDLEINNGTDETNPCDPAQAAGYTGYDATNAIWQAADCDGDGVTNGDEVANGTDPYSNVDTDGDGINDDVEINNGTDETNPCDPAQAAGYTGYDATNAIWQAADCDGDGVTNGDEATNGTDPYVASGDTDGDGIDDDNEINNGTDETNPCDPAQAAGYTGYDATNAIWQAADCDGDGVINGDEVSNGTDPYSAETDQDSDGDGVLDSIEDMNGTDPNNPCSFNELDITEPVTVVCNFDISVTKTVDNEQPTIGDQVTFSIVLTNEGDVDAINIIVEEIIPSGYNYISSVTTIGSYSEFSGIWNVTQLDSGTTEILEVTVEVLEFGDYLNIARISSSEGGTDINDQNDTSSASVEPNCVNVFSEFSPNGDGVNDTFVIDCLENYPNNKLEVYNRWGNKVYEMNNYNSSWDGTSIGRTTISGTEKLPVGTYYYVLDLGDGSKPKVNWLYINR